MCSSKSNFYQRDRRVSPCFPRWFFGKTALVTGATSGIGQEIVRGLVSYGCKVLFCGRNKEAVDSLSKELKEISSSVKGFVADLSDSGSLKGLIEKISKEYDVDILVNNAGFGYIGDFYLMPVDMIYAMQEVNMSAVVSLSSAFLPGMIRKNNGGVLNVGSVASFFATPGSALYGATKHFILGFTDALHQEMRSAGVHVTGVYPGHTQSHFLERATEGRIKDWESAMSPATVARLSLKGLVANKRRVIPGIGNKMRAFAACVIPHSVILKKVHRNAVKHYNSH